MPRSLRENSWCNGWYFRDNRGHSKPRCAEKGGEGRAVQRCCRPWNAVLPYPKPDVTFVGQWPRDDPRSSPQTVSRLRLLRTTSLLLSFDDLHLARRSVNWIILPRDVVLCSSSSCIVKKLFLFSFYFILFIYFFITYYSASMRIEWGFLDCNLLGIIVYWNFWYHFILTISGCNKIFIDTTNLNSCDIELRT